MVLEPLSLCYEYVRLSSPSTSFWYVLYTVTKAVWAFQSVNNIGAVAGNKLFNVETSIIGTRSEIIQTSDWA